MSEADAIHAEINLDHGPSSEDVLQLVSFEIGVEEYAIPILAVQEINRMMPITPVPHSPEAVEGVINLRGRIIPVIDMRKRFGITPSAEHNDARIIVVEIGSDSRVIGFTVDRVHEVIRLDKSIIDPAPTAGVSLNADFIQGVGKLDERLLILLDLERLFTQDDAAAVSAAAKAA